MITQSHRASNYSMDEISLMPVDKVYKAMQTDAVAFDQLADVHGQSRVGCRVVFGSSVVGCHSHSLPWRFHHPKKGPDAATGKRHDLAVQA